MNQLLASIAPGASAFTNEAMLLVKGAGKSSLPQRPGINCISHLTHSAVIQVLVLTLCPRDSGFTESQVQ